MKKTFLAIAKWGWFGIVLLFALGYMASGLSESVDQESTPAVAQQAALRSVPREPSAAGIDEVIQQVNLARQQDLQSRGLAEAPRADWLTICRRVSLAMVGSGLSLEEIRALEQLPEVERVETHVKRLQNDPRFHDYWAERWTRHLVGAENGPFIVFRRRRFRHWLSEQIGAAEPYDRIVSKLITAEGLWTDRPEVNFLTVTFDSNDGNPDPIRLAARTCRAFLGLRIDCLQCHDDFLGNVSLGDPGQLRGGMQSDFHGLAAFYSSAKTNGLQGVKSGEVDYRYQYLDAEEEVEIPPQVPYAEELLPEAGDARSRLAEWVTHSEHRQFSRAAVVRFWALMFGRSPSEAVDNLPLDQSLPDQLQPIIDDFQQHQDLRRTIEIIARCDSFAVSSRADFEITAEHEDHFAVFPLTRLRAEQVAGSIVQASKVKAIDRDSSLLVQLIRFGSINDFLKRYGDLGENEFSKEGITIPQRLLMINGKMLREAGEFNPILNATGHIEMFARDEVEKVDNLFLCLLNRYPEPEERAYFVEQLKACEESSKTIEDFYWTLANSTEFAWNH